MDLPPAYMRSSSGMSVSLPKSFLADSKSSSRSAFFISLFFLIIALVAPFALENHPISQVITYAAVLLIAGVFYGAYRLICRFDVEYDIIVA